MNNQELLDAFAPYLDAALSMDLQAQVKGILAIPKLPTGNGTSCFAVTAMRQQRTDSYSVPMRSLTRNGRNKKPWA